jgi:hypothetical protein
MGDRAIRKLAGIFLAASFAGAFAITGDAQANTNQHGTALKSISSSTQGCFNYDYTGFYRNSNAGSCSGNLTAVAPVIFSPPSSPTSKNVYIDGTCTGTLQAAVWAINYDGTLLGWHSVNLTGSFSTPVSFPTAETSYWGYMHIYTQWSAAIAVGSGCRIRGFTASP